MDMNITLRALAAMHTPTHTHCVTYTSGPHEMDKDDFTSLEAAVQFADQYIENGSDASVTTTDVVGAALWKGRSLCGIHVNN